MTSHQNRLDETVLIKTVLMTGHGTCFFLSGGMYSQLTSRYPGCPFLFRLPLLIRITEFLVYI